MKLRLQRMGDNEPLIGIEKSTRHQHIVGRFGEYFVCNWLSRSGFEVCIVDHTGMDVIAYHPVRPKTLIEEMESNPDSGLIAERVGFLKEKELLMEDICALQERLKQTASDGRPIAVWTSETAK